MIDSIPQIGPAQTPAGKQTEPRPVADPREGTRADAVELSETAQSHLEGPAIRSELVDTIRRQIADGTYDVDGKLDTVVDRLYQEIFAS